MENFPIQKTIRNYYSELVTMLHLLKIEVPEDNIYCFRNRIDTIISRLKKYMDGNNGNGSERFSIKEQLMEESLIVECRENIKMMKELRRFGSRELLDKTDLICRIIDSMYPKKLL